ncbi:16S rRNA (cytosine(1402)-N(4))-methyltransferase RsmH [Paenibacillus endoradicis]|uniref:16S rRNA (cytosine(1402)-N(4))-methyltransferase RsmH n=1 Tax=Paenibacillus endoradicis TaxID=2972487 RepID=UPI0021590C11|nr:16S rRNA (cytosine(1402)-N(4))-methyltransferase RsmH [Paenibacillus endoradicis]MCR8655994.1 16S rRNA (cytosine(1402)-N(4))-methyltransferase RsmH [Paenibacillus endoradicis]MCR8658320.1 16S rRNA (cytosine(1402)-N(4))-methyltransferase RsmH [Paenibacillus endoradicis]
MFLHTTVLLEEAVKGLNIKPNGIYVDCTLGGAGHSQLIAASLGDQGRLIAFDQDDWAHENAKVKLAPYMDKVTLVRSNFRYLEQELKHCNVPMLDGVPQVDGILFDLGVSSPQLDEAERGFSYNQDAPLDMRMDRDEELTAYHIVNEWDERDIARILDRYGEEKFARNIARSIVKIRQTNAIESTEQLAEIVKNAIPAATRRTGGHPAKRSFQALRIAVNDELGSEEEALEAAVRCTAPEGRISVITFHSLEDRICKQTFVKYVEKCSCPPDFPMCVCGTKGKLKLITRKPILPSELEIEQNLRARSAKLRIAEKL